MIDWPDLDAEAARWVWGKIPPHLERIAELVKETGELTDQIERMQVRLYLLSMRLELAVANLQNEATMALTMYRCVGEWAGWEKNDG